MDRMTLKKLIKDGWTSQNFKSIMEEFYQTLSKYLPDATDEEIMKYNEDPKTKKEREENHLLVSTLEARALPLMGDKEEWINKPELPTEKQTLGLQILIIAFYAAEFSTVKDAKNEFKKQICEVLENTEDNLRPILDEIKFLWEYETVLYSLYEFGWGNAKITNLENKNKHQVLAAKKKYMNDKKKVLAFLRENHLSSKEVENHVYEPDKIYFNRHYRQTLKLAKQSLCEDLIMNNNVGERRAREISKILEYI